MKLSSLWSDPSFEPEYKKTLRKEYSQIIEKYKKEV
jgi:hypothetical protein